MTQARKAVALTTVLVVVLLLVSSNVADAVAHKKLYEDLGVDPSASKETIRRTFRKLTRQHHPDLKESYEEKETAKTMMAKILRAYEVLSDDVKRQDYDEAGIIPGEAPDPKDYTAQQLFEHFHQRSPIFSKTSTIDDVEILRRILRFRGPRVFLVQVYDDACTSCRLFSNAWETLFHSGLVEAGILEMYRIEGKSEEGEAMLEEAKVRFHASDPSVFAIIDGEVWNLHGLKEVLQSRSERRIFQAVLDFVMNFFYEVYKQETSLEVKGVTDIVNFLKAARPANKPVRVLFPSINAESVPVAVQLRNNQVEVRSIERGALLEFVEEYCDMNVEAKDRFGEAVPMPEFVVVSTEPLPKGEQEAGDESNDGEAHSCAHIQIGTTGSLTYAKAAQFVEGLLPVRYPGMEGIAYVDMMAHYDVCKKNCLLWVRPDCTQSPDAAMVELMHKNFFSFQTGYVCLNENPRLRSLMEDSTPRTSKATGPLLVAFADGKESEMFRLVELEDKEPNEITSTDIDGALADVLEGVRTAGVVVLMESFSAYFVPSEFPMSQIHRYYLTAVTLFNYARPYITNTAPFLIMFIMQKKFFNRNAPNADAAPAQGATASTGTGAAAASPAATASNAAAAPKQAPTKAAPRRSHPRIAPLTKMDIEEAKESKGFLILVQDGRPAGSGDVPFSSVAHDIRFTMRALDGSAHKGWREWIAEHKPQAAVGDSVPAGERGITVVAVRKQKMLAAIKSDAVSMDDFFRDVLDGTVAVKLEIPELAE